MDSRETSELRNQLAQLTQRVWRLEQTLKQLNVASPQEPLEEHRNEQLEEQVPSAVVVSPHAADQVFAPPPATPAPTAPPPPTFTTQPHAEERSLESRIGSQFFNRIGIVAVLIAAAWFLKFAIDNHWIGHTGRIAVGLITGVGLILWSERFRSKGYSAFSYSLKAVGSGILYLSLWASYDLYHLVPSSIAFLAMILVTAWNGFMAWAQDAELLALYAIVGGFSTPVLVSNGENHELGLFSYLLILNIAVLALVALKPWSRLLLGAFAGTVLYGLGWAATFYRDDEFALTAFFVTVFFLVFAIAPRLLRSIRALDETELPSLRDNLVFAFMPLANAALGFLSFYFMLGVPAREWARPWTAVAFAAFYLALLQLPAPRAIASRTGLLSSLHLTFAVVFLTIAIPLEAHGRWITIGWLVEGAALVWVAQRFQFLLLRVLAAGALILGFVALLTMNPYAAGPVLLNARSATYLVGIAAFALTAWLSYAAIIPAEPGHASEVDQQLAWRNFAGASVLAVNLLLLIAVSLEIHAYWWMNGYNGSWAVFQERRMYAQFSYSAWFMLFGAVLLAIGFLRNTAFLRWQALVLLALSIGKVFTVDLSQLSQGYRILSFLGLGILLLAVSFAYQRDWLVLRAKPGDHPGSPQ